VRRQTSRTIPLLAGGEEAGDPHLQLRHLRGEVEREQREREHAEDAAQHRAQHSEQVAADGLGDRAEVEAAAADALENPLEGERLVEVRVDEVER